MRRNIRFGSTLAVVLAQLLLGGTAVAAVGPTTRVSVSSSGGQANGASLSSAVTGDGRFVVFDSDATNLVSGDTNAATDVFVRDRQAGTTIRVSVGPGGVQGNGVSNESVISSDGRFVAFNSDANNLVSGDTNARTDVFVRDLQTGTTIRASVDSNGTEGNSISFGPSISDDGRIVAFTSAATNLVPGDTNFSQDIFVHDTVTGTTEMGSVDSSGTHANDGSVGALLSSDGTILAFLSFASNLVAGDTNNRTDAFVHDRSTGDTTRVSVSSSGGQANNRSEGDALSADGRFVAFASPADNLVSPDANGGFEDVFVHDRLTGLTTLASVDTSGNQVFADSGSSALSADGRFVAFSSVGAFVPGDGNGFRDVYLHDRNTGATDRASVDRAGAEGNGSSGFADIDADGRFVVFPSEASNLVSGDTNGVSDIFVRDRGLCAGSVVTIQGTDGDDILTGTSGPDVIDGLGGNDTVNGLGGKDKLCGGSGNDSLNGGTGNDRLVGEAGNDAMNGGQGTDTCQGGKGSGDSATNCEQVTGVP
jgi:Tol biopolymer transport system component